MTETNTMKLQVGEGGFELTEDKIELVNRCIEHAEEHFEEHDSKRYGEVCWWDDGDFRIEIIHSYEDGEGEYKHHAESIKYKSSAGRIVYSEYWRDMLGQHTDSIEEYVIEEVEK